MKMKMKLTLKRILTSVLAVVTLLFSCVFVGCTDYGYTFHYRVDGENGAIEIEKDVGFQPSKDLCKDSWCELGCPENSYYFQAMGNKRGTSSLTFIAIPEEGYQVKEWRFNGEVVEGNQTNTYTASVSYKDAYTGVITVKFEPKLS